MIERLSRAPGTRKRLGRCALLLLLAGSLACEKPKPVEGPLEQMTRIDHALQVRLTPAGVGFVESQFLSLSAEMFPEGLSFPFPPTEQKFGLFKLNICPEGCALKGEILDLHVAYAAPNVISVDTRVSIEGTLNTSGVMKCAIPINLQDKPIQMDLALQVHPVDHLLSFEVRSASLALVGSDYDLQCPVWADWLLELFKGWITSTINNTIRAKMVSMMNDGMADFLCLPCDQYPWGCPAPSRCEGKFCMQDGRCRAKPLGLVGNLDLGTLLSGVVPGVQSRMDVFLSAGQTQDPLNSPLVVKNGLEIRLMGGMNAVKSGCVPEPSPGEMPPVSPAPLITFSPTVPGTDQSYMAGVGISQAFVNHALYQGFRSGLFCAGIGTEQIPELNSSTLEIMVPSLRALGQPGPAPVRLALRPTHVPAVQFGAGTILRSESQRVLDKPLFTLSFPGLAMDFYLLLDRRWVRVLTLETDLGLRLGLELTPDNHLIPVMDEGSIVASALTTVAKHHEVLQETPEMLQKLLPTLVELALPVLLASIPPIALPPVQGYNLRVLALRAEMPQANGQAFDHLGIYANVELGESHSRPRNTLAAVRALALPPLRAMEISSAGGLATPRLTVEVGTDSPERAEYSYRLDGGAWSLFQQGPTLEVHSPRLLLQGKHELQIRARTPGDYQSLDPTPTRLTFAVNRPAELGGAPAGRPGASETGVAAPTGPGASQTSAPAPSGPALSPDRPDISPTGEGPTLEEEASGCGCSSPAPGGGAPLWALLAIALALRGRRKRSSRDPQ